jgi:hypothetical protein
MLCLIITGSFSFGYGKPGIGIIERLKNFSDSSLYLIDRSPQVVSWTTSSIRFINWKNKKDTIQYDSIWIMKKTFDEKDSTGKFIRRIRGLSFEISEDTSAAIPKMQRARLVFYLKFTDMKKFNAKSECSIDVRCNRTVWELENIKLPVVIDEKGKNKINQLPPAPLPEIDQVFLNVIESKVDSGLYLFEIPKPVDPFDSLMNFEQK